VSINNRSGAHLRDWTMVNQRRSTRRKYDRASTTDDNPNLNDADRPSSSTTLTLQTEDKDPITIQILDSAQNKFAIPSITPTTCTVQQLKDIGCAIHGVSPPQQRLIFMGKLLNEDTSCLSHYGIKRELSIIHLFPKPTVVIERSGGGDGGEDTSLCSPTSNDNDANDNETAHIPQIILDASEAERHSSVIILSSHEAFEILHRVRLCAFCLLVYSSMELLQDLTLWMGKSLNNDNEYCDDDDNDGCPEYRPDEPTDTTAPSPNGNSDHLQWKSWNYFDVLLSIFAFYVSMLGIKVTTEHERSTARLFWNLLVLLAVLWNGFYYWRAVQDIMDDRQKRKGSKEGGGDHSNDNGSDASDPSLEETSPYNLALWYMSFLFLIWFVFLFWARQFKNMMEEAGAEAEERTRSLSNGTTLNATGYGGADSVGVESDASQGVQNGVTDGVVDPNRGEAYDLELQLEGRSIT